jgi:mono/diheme cytochrome c family protein
LKPFIEIAVLGMLLSAAFAQSGQTGTSLMSNPVYQQNCSKCHGKNADGRMFAGPSLVNEKAVSMPADDLRNIITNGKHRMPKFGEKLNPSEIDALVSQIKAQAK